MLEQTGIPTTDKISAVLPVMERLNKGPIAIFECFQNIPCNPCVDACPQGAISIGADINERPVLDESKCNGCGICITHCPGLSIFVIDYAYAPDTALIKLPYEYWPLPATGETVDALNRQGKAVAAAEIVRVQQNKNKTNVVWVSVPKALIMEVRGIALRKEG
ncbi:4Fe-4S dicluster domain-containing protein [Sporomusa acidovorans]|uniref:Ferredoxin-type protein NapF n=1 Tax=Sporomusa acidovorans (strain ATCC 49682 / DSM 3132 / Mol) TaxID=1123286 RepID=A0ABZ3J340_SPOA4|nr:4Fe-4S dicluster domain-containing protein [Sporomusa acidovorans]OZC20255.1 electron transport complex subunit RsxB [Sporomusa acidovorans DSM 3132]SDD40423.1 4Fe-4S dicluster domain-containing protein [Sporomusa acidovorans]